MLSVLTVRDNRVQILPLKRFLLQGVTVTCGLVVSTAPCFIENQSISANISILQPQAGGHRVEDNLLVPYGSLLCSCTCQSN